MLAATLLAIFFVPVLFVVVYRYTRRIKKASRAVRQKESELLTIVQEVLSSIRVVKAFSREDYEQQRFEEQSLENVETALQARAVKAKLTPTVEVLSSNSKFERVAFEGAGEWFGPDWTSRVGDASSAVRVALDARVRVAAPQAQLLVLCEGAKPLRAPIGSVKINGREVYKFAVTQMAGIIEQTCCDAGVRVGDLALVIPHQANKRIIEAIGKRLGLSDDKVFVNLDRYGNTSSASIPIALDEANRTGAIHTGDLVLLDAFGGGLTCGAMSIRWQL